jgi:heptosyltransferase-1
VRVLIVKLSSLGDVVHAMPVVHDIRAAHPGAVIDWVVEPAFAPLVRRVDGVREVIECALRRWRRGWWTSAVRAEWRSFRARLQHEAYDAVIDLQGLTKSALVARMARGLRFGLANRTEGSSYEAPAGWLVDHAIRIEPHIHAMDRSRALVAAMLARPAEGPPVYGLRARPPAQLPAGPGVAFVHGSSRDDKLWPVANWVALGKRVIGAGWRIGLPQGNEAEQTRAEMIAAGLQYEKAFQVEVWPSLALDAVLDRLGALQGVVGVDSGLSHLAVALDLPHVQLYNHATAWRTGPLPEHGHRHQVSVEVSPTPPLEAVWSAWNRVLQAARG